MSTVGIRMVSSITDDRNIGLIADDRMEIAAALRQFVSNSYALMAKLHGFHWNVSGPQFPGLHDLFEGQYTELFAAIDEIAERIRALGVLAPDSLSELDDAATLPKVELTTHADAMLRVLVDHHEFLARNARDVAQRSARFGDGATEDLMNARMAAHEKAAWMLRASFEG